MSEYIAPLKDMQFVLRELADMDAVSALPGHEEVNAELADAILEEAGKFANGVLSPLNWTGDREGAKWKDGEVTTAPGWKQAYSQFVDGGWNALSCPTEFGGQGLPHIISAMVEEMWNASNTSFMLCPMLTRGAIEALQLCGSDAQKAMYLPDHQHGEAEEQVHRADVLVVGGVHPAAPTGGGPMGMVVMGIVGRAAVGIKDCAHRGS